MGIYSQNPWKPAPFVILKDKAIEERVSEAGFYVKELITKEVLSALKDFYNQNHHFEASEGGMFYSIYSQDLTYRRNIHNFIAEQLRPFVDEICHKYKMVLNSFVIKVSGPQSEFYLHQDTTGLDEWLHSPLSLWIPLQDVDEQNGCLGVIPFSQHFFTPYRSISFPAPFDTIQEEVKKYLVPVRMKAGEVLIFDNRILHHSYANLSGTDRISVICGLFPEEATFLTCHKTDYTCGGEVELIQHSDDFLLTGKNFLMDCQKRPETGKSLGWVEDPYPAISMAEFEALCQRFELEKTSDTESYATNCIMIAEPKQTAVVKEKNEGILKKIKQLLAIQ